VTVNEGDSTTESAGPRDGAATPGAPKVWFDAVLHPHRSLSPFGFLVLMGALSAVSFATGIAFLMAGAWPVFGFFGLDVLLVYLAFRVNYRSGRIYEMLRLTRDELSVRRVFPSGTSKSWSFQSYWLRVEMDDPPRPDSVLALSSHGNSLAIGAFLTPDEKLEVARALGAALAVARRPENA
jgi:uncharacterized membrane protein